jgi:hypothetical protein
LAFAREPFWKIQNSASSDAPLSLTMAIVPN